MTMAQTTQPDTGTDPAVEWVTVEPADAERWLQNNDANRGLRARAVNAYARDMEHGKWMLTGESVKFDRHGNLLDGQHRLSAIVQSGQPPRLLIVSGIDPAVRTVIDTGAVRTGGDALRIAGLGGGNPYALASAARLLVLWHSGRLVTMTSGMRGEDRATHSEIVDMVTHRPDLLDAVHESTRDYQRIGIPPGPGAMCRTVLADIDPADSILFWESLAGYSTEGANDPRSTLLVTIRQMRELGQLRRPGESIGLVFTAWNAWRDKQNLRHLATRDSKGKPLRIPQPV